MSCSKKIKDKNKNKYEYLHFLNIFHLSSFYASHFLNIDLQNQDNSTCSGQSSI